MELKIYTPEESFPKKIDWNYDDLKAELLEKVKDYEVSVYSDDDIKSAKADRAKLNNLITAIKGKRTDIRKTLLAPDEAFKLEVEDLTGLIQKAVTNIDSQVKGYEERQREEKTAKVKEFYEANIFDLTDYLPFGKVFKPQYANASTTLKSIKEEILALIQRVAEGMATLNEVDSPYAGDMKAVFLQNYDINAAMAERNRLEVAEKKRAEYEAERAKEKTDADARLKAETEHVIYAGKFVGGVDTSMGTDTTVITETPVTVLETAIPEDKLITLDFRIHATGEQLQLLKEFLVLNKIKYGPVPKGEVENGSKQ